MSAIDWGAGGVLAEETTLLDWDMADLRGAVMGYRGIRDVILVLK